MAAFDIIEAAVRALPSGNAIMMTTADAIMQTIRTLARR